MISFNFSSTNVYHFRCLHFSEHKLYIAYIILPSYKNYAVFVYYGIYTIHISIHSYFVKSSVTEAVFIQVGGGCVSLTSYVLLWSFCSWKLRSFLE